MIIVEGCDGAGKSTLVKKICEDFGLREGERGTKNRDDLWKYTVRDTYYALEDAVSMRDPAVWDRLFYSEMFYAPAMGREMQFTPEDIRFINGVICGAQFPVIICMPPLEVIKENIKGSHHLDVVADNIVKLDAAYAGLAANLKSRFFNCYTYNYTLDNEDGVTELNEYAHIYQAVHDYLELRSTRGPHNSK